MAHRQVGQEAFCFGGTGKGNDVDALAALIDWSGPEALMAEISSAAKGQQGWPPLCLLKALLLARWYDLSDVKLAEALDDRASFRRFCGFSRSELTPERTTFVRFRRELVRRGLADVLFEAISAQLIERHVVVKQGTLVDATIIASASKSDGDARWVKHKNRKSVHGYKAHVASDLNSDLVKKVRITPANVNDGVAGCDVVPDHPGEVFADSAYRGARFRAAVASKGGTARVIASHVWAKSEAEATLALKAINGPIHKVRGRIEKIFGTWKRSWGLRQMPHVGLGKAALHILLTAMAWNLKRGLSLTGAAKP